MVRQISTVDSVCEEIDQLVNKITEPLDGMHVTLILAALLTASASILDDLIKETLEGTLGTDTILCIAQMEKRSNLLKVMLAEIVDSRVGR